MGRYSGKSCRFVLMITLTTVFFLVELVTGYATKSLALVSDSFHMLSDIIALIIGFLALRISKKSTPDAGLQRAEVLGALINSVLLMALCFTIFVDAIQRLIVVETIENPVLVLIVGCVGLVVNGIGLCLFGTHGMPHGHSHADGTRDSPTATTKSKLQKSDMETATHEEAEKVLANQFTYVRVDTNADVTGGEKEQENNTTPNKTASHAHLNMRGVFLHVLGDALGSVVVIISALFIWLTDFEWRHYVDPAMSLIIVAILTITTVPLFRQSSRILMQSLPSDMNLRESKEEIQENSAGNSYVATAHICFYDNQNYTVMAEEIRNYLIDRGIDAVTALQDNVNHLPSNGLTVRVDDSDHCAPLTEIGDTINISDHSEQRNTEHKDRNSSPNPKEVTAFSTDSNLREDV